jgi:NodT family efflux transporter outer membrane factor (OMF) lipoprotein
MPLRHLRSLALGALAPAALAACAVGPAYHPPETPRLPTLEGAPVAGGGPPAPDWWRLYGDPALDRDVDRALARNTDLRAADANIAAAEAALKGAQAAFTPTGTVSGGWEDGISPAAFGEAASVGRRPTPAPFLSLNAGLAADLDLFGRTRRTIEAARGDAGAAAAARDQVRDTVVAGVVRAYLDSCAQAAALGVADRGVDTAAVVSARTERLRTLGGAADFDVERARALEAQSRAALPQLRAGQRAAELELAALQGDLVEADPPPCKTVPVLGGAIAAGDPVGLLRRRGDVRQAERRLAAETARIGVAVADLYPTISLSGSLQSSAAKLAQLGGPLALSYGLGPQISWTFPRAEARARVRQARATAAAALANFDGAVVQALKETRQALVGLAAERARRGELIAARDRRARSFAIAQARHRAGGVSFLELLQAESDLITADQAVATSDQAVAEDEVAVFRALGSEPGG